MQWCVYCVFGFQDCILNTKGTTWDYWQLLLVVALSCIVTEPSSDRLISWNTHAEKTRSEMCSLCAEACKPLTLEKCVLYRPSCSIINRTICPFPNRKEDGKGKNLSFQLPFSFFRSKPWKCTTMKLGSRHKKQHC